MNKLLTVWEPLRSMALHRDMCVEVIERAVTLQAALPAALVYSLNLLVSPSRPLPLAGAREGNEIKYLHR